MANHHPPAPLGARSRPRAERLTPQERPESSTYRRWAGALLLIAAVLGAFVVVALVASFALLALAGTDDAAYGYLAIFLWFAVAAAVPLLLGAGIPALVMRRRIRKHTRAVDGGEPAA